MIACIKLWAWFPSDTVSQPEQTSMVCNFFLTKMKNESQMCDYLHRASNWMLWSIVPAGGSEPSVPQSRHQGSSGPLTVCVILKYIRCSPTTSLDVGCPVFVNKMKFIRMSIHTVLLGWFSQVYVFQPHSFGFVVCREAMETIRWSQKRSLFTLGACSKHCCWSHKLS